MYIANEPALTPLIKWAGGKAKMIPQLLHHMPDSFYTFHSLFAGGAALYLRVGQPGHIADMNHDLINFYRVVASEPDDLAMVLFDLEERYNESNEKDKFYYRVRAEHNEVLVDSSLYITPVASAAEFLFLNKCGFNGLYRVNRKGEFNAPWGHKESIKLISDFSNFQHVSGLLSRTGIYRMDYRDSLKYVRSLDFVYADPPYYSEDGGFNGYSNSGNWNDPAEQRKLEFHLRSAANRGAMVMTTNSDTPFIHNLYKDWNIHRVEMPRRISASTEGRGKHTELIITSYETEQVYGQKEKSDERHEEVRHEGREEVRLRAYV